MAFIQLNEKQIPVGADEVSIGGHSGATISIANADGKGPAAVVMTGADGKAAIRRVDANASVKVNGVALGVEPTPLIHGDKIEVSGQELTFADEQKSGSTQFLSAAQIAEFRRSLGSSGNRGKPTASTGGRIVSLVDGKEYAVPDDRSLTIGRDASCDVVIPSNDVSRNHAEIASGPDGYYVIDTSTNGVFVNGQRVDGTQTLGRADVVRLGSEEFRFYADKLEDAPAAAAAAPVAATPAVAPAPEPAAPVAAAPAPVAAPVLATLEVVNEGPTKGTRYEIRGPLTNVGRGAHNDISIVDGSVSDQHAKITRRDGEWYVQDVGSTNGTYVAGKRISEETQLVGAPDVRFGSIKTVFRPSATAPVEEKGTRVIAGVKTEPARRETSEAAPAPKPAAKSGGVPAIVWVVVAVAVVAVVAFLAMRGR